MTPTIEEEYGPEENESMITPKYIKLIDNVSDAISRGNLDSQIVAEIKLMEHIEWLEAMVVYVIEGWRQTFEDLGGKEDLILPWDELETEFNEKR